MHADLVYQSWQMVGLGPLDILLRLCHLGHPQVSVIIGLCFLNHILAIVHFVIHFYIYL